MRTEDLESSKISTVEDVGTPCVVVVSSPDESLGQRRFTLAPARTVGRREDGDADDPSRIAVADPRVSHDHATLRWRVDDQGCEISDAQSRNGTFVERRRVATAFVPVGGIVRMGDTFVEVSTAPTVARTHALLHGQSAALGRLLGDIERVARSDVTVLVEGETGTGKELVAEAIHAASRRPGALVSINCASISPEIAESFLFGHRKGSFTGAHADAVGVFERANDGTLFLDEIGELRLDLQAKLLRVLETRELMPVGAATARVTTARVVGATNARLRAQVAAHTFRADLFARLAQFELAVPALRRRRSDIPLLLAHFLERAAPGVPFTVSPNAMESLLLHDWPMNVRELKAVCDRLALALPSGGRVKSAHLAAVFRLPASEPPPAVDAAPPGPGREELTAQLRTHRGNVLGVARHYGKDRKQIYRWLEVHALDPRDFRG